MNLSSLHPSFIGRRSDWTLCRDAYEGERQVKGRGQEYLPPTDGMIRQGMQANQKGLQRYESYKKRAYFPDIVELAVNAMVGLMHIKAPSFSLPSSMEPLLKEATAEHEPLSTLLRRINMEQILVGRYGLLPDLSSVPTTAAVLPFIASYQTEKILNWDDGRTEGGAQNLLMVSLDESEFERLPSLEWDFVTKHRLLWLGPLFEGESADLKMYRSGLVRGDAFSPAPNDMIAPSFAGTTLDYIPFQFIGCKDLVPDPDKPPVLNLANLAMAIYRGEADYRTALHMVGQDTLVIAGLSSDEDGDGDFKTGPGASILLPMGATAQYVGTNSQGIPHMRTQLDGDYDRAGQAGASMLNATGGDQQSGEALRIRVAAKTATLTNVAITGAAGLERVLKNIAKWIGANPDEVSVKPNLDFANVPLSATELVQLMAAKSSGAPIALRTIHGIMQNKGITEFDFEAEIEEIRKEEAEGLGMPSINTGGSEPGSAEEVSDPSSPNYDPNNPAYDATLDSSSDQFVDPNAEE